MLHGRTIRSSIARGRIRSVSFDLGADGFTVVDYRDMPGRNVVALIADDQPCLAEREVRHFAEPILLLAHEDPERLLEARVEIDYEAARPVFDPLHSPTVFKSIAIDKGDLEAGFREADLVVEGEYRVGHQEHAYIETNGVIAVPGDDGITLYGSLQCPYYVQKALSAVLGLPARPRARRAGGDRRRVRRQGGIPVDHRRARLPAGAEGRAAGQARLRPRRGHGWPRPSATRRSSGTAPA